MGQWNYGLCKIKPDSPDCPKKPCHALFQGAELRGITRIFLYLFRVIREIRAYNHNVSDDRTSLTPNP